MTYEVIDSDTGNTVASFGTFDEAWSVLEQTGDDKLLLIAFDSEGHALGGASLA